MIRLRNILLPPFLALTTALFAVACDGAPVTTVTPTRTPTAIVRETATATSTPTPTAIPKLEPYKLYCLTCTPEELERFNSKLDASYKRVVDVYGVAPDGRLILVIGPRKQTYSVEFEENLVGGVERALTIDDSGLGYPTSHFDKGVEAHEISHRFLRKFFPTYHSWFDEGLAIYASGELSHPGYLSNHTEAKTRGVEWFNERNTPHVNPGHLLGSLYFTALGVDYGLTIEKNRTALEILVDTYKATGTQPTRWVIQAAYEDALGLPARGLDPLFDLMAPGVKILYSTNPEISGTEGYKINQIIRSEFQTR